MTGQPIKRVFTGNRVVLPGADQPTPATIVVDIQTGKIIDTSPGRSSPDDQLDVDFIDAGDKIILPGLVE